MSLCEYDTVQLKLQRLKREYQLNAWWQQQVGLNACRCGAGGRGTASSSQQSCIPSARESASGAGTATCTTTTACSWPPTCSIFSHRACITRCCCQDQLR